MNHINAIYPIHHLQPKANACNTLDPCNPISKLPVMLAITTAIPVSYKQHSQTKQYTTIPHTFDGRALPTPTSLPLDNTFDLQRALLFFLTLSRFHNPTEGGKTSIYSFKQLPTITTLLTSIKPINQKTTKLPLIQSTMPSIPIENPK